MRPAPRPSEGRGAEAREVESEHTTEAGEWLADLHPRQMGCAQAVNQDERRLRRAVPFAIGNRTLEVDASQLRQVHERSVASVLRRAGAERSRDRGSMCRATEMPEPRLALKHLGKGTGMDWQSVRGRVFSQDRHTDSALHKRTGPLPWDPATGVDG